MAEPEFTSLKIVRVVRETPDAISVALGVPPEMRPAFAYRPGQHLHVRAAVDDEVLQRTYSLCSDAGEPELRIAIKAIPGGQFSGWANRILTPGMQLEVGRPQGRFVLPVGDGAPRHILALAAGAGITPIIGIVRQVLETEPQSRVTLIYGNRTLRDIIFAAELEDLKDRHLERFTLVNVLSRDDDPEMPLLAGRIDAAKVAELCRRLVDLREIAQAFVCGPGDMIKTARNALIELGLSRERVHHEFFAAGAGGRRATVPVVRTLTAAVGDSQVEIVATLDGMRHRFTANPGEPVIEAALRAGVRVPYACKGGMCCTCRAKLVEGTAPMRVNYSLEQWEIDKGFVLTCQAVPSSARVVLDYDAM